MTCVCFLKKKSQAFKCFKVFRELVENETILKIKCLRLNNGGEFTSNEFKGLCEEHGIRIQLSTGRTPQKIELLKERKKNYTRDG
jgi:transposase InsO family protein